jgi:GntR family transcriptional regulator
VERAALKQSLQSATVNSTLLAVKVEHDDSATLHSQVAAQIRQAIADGEAKPGVRLPPAHHLAAVMGVNTNTVLRALRQLRDEGLVEMRPRRGIHVTGTPQQGELRGKVAELVTLARSVGCTRAELLGMIANAP